MIICTTSPSGSSRSTPSARKAIATRWNTSQASSHRGDSKPRCNRSSCSASRRPTWSHGLGPPRADGLIISGHVDTVPFDGQPGWEREPLKLEVAGERIYGRGTTDMKGFIAQCLDAARTLDSARLRRPLVFVFTASEEVGCLGAHSVAPALKQILGDTPVPRLAWIGEPTSWGVCHAHKSIVSFSVTVRGIGGHSGAPARGVNAIAVMAPRHRHHRPLSAGARCAPAGRICGDFSRRAARRAEFRNGARRNRAQHDRRGMQAARQLSHAARRRSARRLPRDRAPARRARRPRLCGRRTSRENRDRAFERRAAAGLAARNGSGSRAVRRHRRKAPRAARSTPPTADGSPARASRRSSAARAISSRRISPTSTSGATPSSAAPR